MSLFDISDVFFVFVIILCWFSGLVIAYKMGYKFGQIDTKINNEELQMTIYELKQRERMELNNEIK